MTIIAIKTVFFSCNTTVMITHIFIKNIVDGGSPLRENIRLIISFFLSFLAGCAFIFLMFFFIRFTIMGIETIE